MAIEARSGGSIGSSTDGLTRSIAEFIVELKYEDLPADVIDKTKQLIRDGLGNQLAASSMDTPARQVRELFQDWGGRGEATVVGYGDRFPIPHTTMVNAMLGHGVELDDAHANALTKSGSALVPATIAFAESTLASGRDAIVAAVVGYDVMVRIGLAINPAHRQRGYHTTGTASPFGVAAVGSKLLNLGVEETLWALGLAGMQSAGVQAFLDDPCMAKPFSPGKGAFNGSLAAILASRGFTGPRTILEGKEGFLNAFAGEYRDEELRRGLGHEFKVLEVAFKPHAACRYAHGPIDAAHELRRTLSGATNDISSVTVFMSDLAIRQSGRTDAPTLNTAMGSTPFGVAVGLLLGSNGLGDYRKAFEDQRVHELAKRVRVEPYGDAGVMGREALVSVALNDGKVSERRVAGPRGEPGNPLSEAELRDKFLGLAGLAVGDEVAVQIAEATERLEQAPDLRQLIALFGGPSS